MFDIGGTWAGDEASGEGAPGAQAPGAAARSGSQDSAAHRRDASAEAREGPDHSRPVRSGGSEAERFREFVVESWISLLRTAYLLTGDHGHAEDLVQTALIRLHRHWGKVERNGSPESYVRRVMFNLHTDWWRRLGSRERTVRLTADFDHPSSGDAYASFDLRDELWEALRALPAKMRATLVLRYFEDLGEAETAQILGCSVGTVKSQASRGLHRLQQALSAQPQSPHAPTAHSSTEHASTESALAAHASAQPWPTTQPPAEQSLAMHVAVEAKPGLAGRPPAHSSPDVAAPSDARRPTPAPRIYLPLNAYGHAGAPLAAPMQTGPTRRNPPRQAAEQPTSHQAHRAQPSSPPSLARAQPAPGRNDGPDFTSSNAASRFIPSGSEASRVSSTSSPEPASPTKPLSPGPRRLDPR